MRVEQRLRIVPGFVDFHGQAGVASHFGNRLQTLARLLEHDVEVADRVADTNRVITRRAAVPVGVHNIAVADCLTNRPDPRYIPLPVRVRSNLDLELANTLLKGISRNLSHALRVSAGDGMIGRHAVGQLAAEQLIKRHTRSLGRDIPESDVERGLRVTVIGQIRIAFGDQRLDAARIRTE